jgi:hypothetical protein
MEGLPVTHPELPKNPLLTSVTRFTGLNLSTAWYCIKHEGRETLETLATMPLPLCFPPADAVAVSSDPIKKYVRRSRDRFLSPSSPERIEGHDHTRSRTHQQIRKIQGQPLEHQCCTTSINRGFVKIAE